jgi:hypothetical protein
MGSNPSALGQESALALGVTVLLVWLVTYARPCSHATPYEPHAPVAPHRFPKPNATDRILRVRKGVGEVIGEAPGMAGSFPRRIPEPASPH